MMNKIGFSLIVIFVISSVILLAELFYVLWRRRLFHRQAPRSSATTESSSTGGAASYSKDLIYFYLCLNSSRISRVEPESSAPPIPNSGHSSPGDDAEEVIDVFKLQNMCYGPPRFLFTINEEDESNESGGSRSVRLKEVLMAASADDDQDYKAEVESTGKECAIELDGEFLKAAAEDRDHSAAAGESMGGECAVELDGEFLKAAAGDQDHSVAAAAGELVGGECSVELDGEIEAETTPFTTPCGSPLYFFTPTASPIHQLRIAVPALSAADYCEEA